VAGEWLSVGLALAKLLIRAADRPLRTEALNDAPEAWAAIRAAHHAEVALGSAIATRLEQGFGHASRVPDDDLRVAALGVANLLSRLAEDQDALNAAAYEPNKFAIYAREHALEHERWWTSDRDTSIFDLVLEASGIELARLVPTSWHFEPATLNEVIGQLPSKHPSGDEFDGRDRAPIVRPRPEPTDSNGQALPRTSLGAGGARDPDRLIRWFLGVVVAGVTINLLSESILKQKWAWLPPAFFVAALLVTIPTTGLLRRERQGSTRWARVLALLALGAYLAVAVWGSRANWPTAVMLLSVAFLWGAVIVLLWSTLRARRSAAEIATATAFLLLGSAGMLWGLADQLHGSSLAGGALLLLGIAYLVIGVALLLQKAALAGVGNIVLGVALIAAGNLFLEGGPVLVGWGLILLGCGDVTLGAMVLALSFGKSIRRPRSVRAYAGRPPRRSSNVLLASFIIMSLFLGLALFTIATLLLMDQTILFGIVALLLGVGYTLGGLDGFNSWRRRRSPRFGRLLDVLALLSSCAVFSVLGTMFLDQSKLMGLAFLLVSASLLVTLALLYSSRFLRQVLAWLVARDETATARSDELSDSTRLSSGPGARGGE
jgi:hypothetical protein